MIYGEDKLGQKSDLWYPVSIPAFRIMPETRSPARGSRNFTPRIEPPKMKKNEPSSVEGHKIELY